MFPPVFGQLARVGATRGLVISVIVVLLLANFVTAIATLGSVVALALFLITSIAAYRLKKDTKSRESHTAGRHLAHDCGPSRVRCADAAN